LIVVDTPGFGDTSGPKQDEIISAKLKSFFSTKLDKIHAICFVCISALERLSPTQEYILAKITEMFGGDVARSVTILATFCDGGPVKVKNALSVSASFNTIAK